MRIKIGYLIREGFRSIGTHGFMSFASVAIIVACLVIMGSMTLLSLNIDAVISDLEDQNEIVAFVDEELNEEEAMGLQDQLLAVENVSDAEFVNREAAMTTFMSKYDSELMEGIDADVFRHRYVLHLSDISIMKETKQQLEDIPGIAKVNAHLDYADSFVKIRNVVSVISVVLIAIMVFVSVFIMTNTIKLATFSRREEIAIMKMVGATNSFIRTPFVVEGLVLGLLGGGIAFGAEMGIYRVIIDRILSSFTGSLLNLVPFETVSMPMLAAFLAVGVLVGVFGGTNAIRNYLRV